MAIALKYGRATAPRALALTRCGCPWFKIARSTSRLSSNSSLKRLTTCRAAAGSENSKGKFGIFVCSGSPAIAETICHSGVDWICLDMQHGAVGYEGLAALLMATSAAAAKRIVRVGGPTDQFGIQQALDLGADGVMVPLVNNREDAMQAVSYCRYAPDGIRSVAYPIRAVYPRGVGIPALASYIRDANRNVEVWLQVETKQCYQQMDLVLSVPGVTCAFLGPADLSFSLGLHTKYGYDLAAALNSEEMEPVYDNVLQACLRHNVESGVFCLGASRARALADMGYRHIAYDADTNVLINYCQATSALLRSDQQS